MRSKTIYRTISAVAIALAMVGSSPLCAEEEKDTKQPLAPFGKLPEEIGKLVDGDDDGMITDKEAQQAAGQLQKEANAKRKTDRGEAVLKALDRDKNGKVDKVEAEEAVAQERIERDEAGRRVAAIFDALDANSDRVLDNQEFRALVERLGPFGKLLAPRLAQFFNRLDVNRDSLVSVVESQLAADYFAQQAGIRRRQKAAQQNAKLAQQVKQTFAQFDRNRNGKISSREARRNQELQAVFEQIDTDEDKNATPEEVYKYLESQQSKE